MSQPTLYLMLGYPGAGKTSDSEFIHELTGAVHLNSDRFRLHMFDRPLEISEQDHENMYMQLDYIARIILESGKSVIYDANLNRYKHREEKYELARRTGAITRLIWVRTSSITAKQRATIDALNDPHARPFGNMDTETFERLIAEIEPPKPDENTVEITGGNNSKETEAKALGLEDLAKH